MVLMFVVVCIVRYVLGFESGYTISTLARFATRLFLIYPIEAPAAADELVSWLLDFY